MTSLPHITTKQQHILTLLYTYRFLDRTQIQTFLTHKDKQRIILWLKDLRDKQYVDWQYNAASFIDKSKPAIYYLSLNGIRYLRETGSYPSETLRKRYYEKARSQTYIERCLLVAACCINMDARTAEHNGLTYCYTTETDYADPTNDYHFLTETDIRPQLYYTKREDTGRRKVTTTHLLDILDTSLPRYTLRKRLKDYVAFLDSGDWEEHTGQSQLPGIMLTCPTKADFIYVKRCVRRLLEASFGDLDELPEDLKVRVATHEQLKRQGLTARIWETVV
jgi:hypothetical protein